MGIAFVSDLGHLTSLSEKFTFRITLVSVTETSRRAHKLLVYVGQLVTTNGRRNKGMAMDSGEMQAGSEIWHVKLRHKGHHVDLESTRSLGLTKYYLWLGSQHGDALGNAFF